MKVATKSWRYLSAVASLLSLAFLAIPSVPAASDAGGRVIRPTSRKALQTYQKLAAAWWNWALQFPAATNPVVDATGDFCHLGQEGPVWFLAGTFGGAATRRCTVPEGKFLFFPIANVVFWAPEDGDTEEEVRAGANAAIDTVSVVECTIDRVPVKKLLQKHRGETPAFELHLPEGGFLDDIDAFLPGDRFPAVADGYWVLVRPLSEGRHVLRFQGVIKAFNLVSEVIYHLTVVEDDDD